MILTRIVLPIVAATLVFLATRAVCDSPAAPKPAEEPFHKELLKIAAEYKSWGRVDDEFRWAPELCRMPNPGQPKESASTDEKTHGQKLYSLFARNWLDYIAVDKKTESPVNQAVVKQSWIPEEITDEKDKPSKQLDPKKIVTTPNPEGKGDFDKHDHFYPYVWKGEKVFKASKQADLFIMMKLDPKTPGTDNGWVYATVSADGKKVTAAGKIESCMKCHQDAKHDRLFGLAK